MPAPPRIRMQEIADAVGVTVATVSLALKNSPRISADRRREIAEVAGRLGYVPDPALRALARYRMRSDVRIATTLGFLYHGPTGQDLDAWGRQPFRRSLLKGLRTRAHELGYQVDGVNLNSYREKPGRLVTVLEARGIEGVISAASTPADLLPLPPERFAIATVGKRDSSGARICVLNNHYHAMETALTEIVARGYQRALFVLNEKTLPLVGSEWIGAFLLFAREHPDMETGTLSMAEFRRTVSRQNRRMAKKRTAIIAWTQAPRRLLARHALHAPKDYGFCFLDTDATGAAGTGIFQRSDQIGALAVEQLNRVMEYHAFGPSHHLPTLTVDGIWVDGDTV